MCIHGTSSRGLSTKHKVPQPSVHASCAYHAVADLHKAVDRLWVAWVAVCYVPPQSPVVYHQAAFTITTYHLSTTLRTDKSMIKLAHNYTMLVAFPLPHCPHFQYNAVSHSQYHTGLIPNTLQWQYEQVQCCQHSSDLSGIVKSRSENGA